MTQAKRERELSVDSCYIIRQDKDAILYAAKQR